MQKKILILKADGTVLPFTGRVTLKSLQAAVGGMVEHVRVLDRIEGEDQRFIYTTMYVNEEGLLNGLPRNSKATEIYQRNIRAQYPRSEHPFKEAQERIRKMAEARGAAFVLDLIPDSAKVAGYEEDPYIVGDVVFFRGYTCEEADELYEVVGEIRAEPEDDDHSHDAREFREGR